MDRNQCYKRTEDVEVDLMELLRSFCMKWKQAAVCAIVGMLLLGGYGYLKNRENNVSEETKDKEEISLTEEEQQEVLEALQVNQEVSSMEEYMENSVLMQIDTYHKDQMVMLYRIHGAQIQILPEITESYINFLSNGGAVQAVKNTDQEFDELEAVYLQELVTVRQPSGGAEDMDRSDDSESQTLLYLEVTGKDIQMVQHLAEDLQNAMEEYSSSVRKNCGNHQLRLIDHTASVVIDSSLLAQQQRQRELLKAGKANLKVVTDALSGNQKMVYEEDSRKEGEDVKKVMDTQSTGISLRYIVSGFCAGIFVYGCIFLCLYLLRSAIRSENEFKACYLFPVFGSIPFKNAGKYPAASVQRQAQALGRVRLACKKQGITKLCLAAEFSEENYRKEAMERIAGQFEEWGIQTVAAWTPESDISQWNMLEEIGTVLMVCGIGLTPYAVVDHAMDFYQENDIHMIGSLLLDHK